MAGSLICKKLHTMSNIRDFNVGNTIYSNLLAFNLIDTECKISIDLIIADPIIESNLLKREWFDQNGENGISIINVIDNPHKFPNHYRRMQNADMSYPIILWEETGLITDGNHRLGHAKINNHETIKAYIFTDDDMEKIKIGTFTTWVEYADIVKNFIY